MASRKTHGLKEAEKGAADAASVMAAKGETAKAQLERMKAAIASRVAYAQFMEMLGREQERPVSFGA
jgi:hypothetical protein